MIFERHFKSIRVTQGFNIINDHQLKALILGEKGPTTSHHTAILRTCRLFHQEGRDLVGPNVLFCFPAYLTMLQCLSEMDPEVIKSVRHVHVMAREFSIKIQEGPKAFRRMKVYIGHVLGCLRGLRLERLTIDSSGALSPFEHTKVYMDFCSLLKTGGWGSVRYITSTARSRRAVPLLPPTTVQSFIGNGVLEHVSGGGRHTNVAMHLTEETDTAWSPMTEDWRKKYETLWWAPATYLSSEQLDTLKDNGFPRGSRLHVVMERDMKKCLDEDESSVSQDSRPYFRGKTWGQIKKTMREIRYQCVVGQHVFQTLQIALE